MVPVCDHITRESELLACEYPAPASRRSDRECLVRRARALRCAVRAHRTSYALCAARDRLGLVGVAGDVSAPSRQRRHERYIGAGLMYPSVGRHVLRGARADEDAADSSVRKSELHLL